MSKSKSSGGKRARHDAMDRVFSAVHDVNRIFASVTDLDELLRLIVEISEQAVEAEASALLLYDPQREDLYFRVARGLRGDHERLKHRLRLPLGKGLAGHAARTRRSVNVADAQQDERFYPLADEISGLVTHSVIAVPMVGHDELVGVIEVLNKRGGNQFTDMDVEALEIFAQQAALAIQDARLVEANIQAERLAAVGTAVEGLSHYAKNILAGLAAGCELVDYALENDQIEAVAEGWRLHKRTIARLSVLVADMLAFGRVPRRAPLRRSCCIADLVEDIMDEHRPFFRQREIEAATHIEAVPEACIDRAALRHVLSNFLSNAVEAAPATGGQITVTLSRVQGDDTVHITVSDNGPGIPQDMLTQVFEPFFTTKGSHGTGLGLAVVTKIINEQGWLLEVQPEQPTGITFRIAIPDAFDEGCQEEMDGK